ncbi:hypothetical protein ACFLYP_04390 [Chloroflexota bacterium]
MAGKKTGEFGYWLDNQLKEKLPNYRVFYDHGNSELENVGEIQGFYGATATRQNILTHVDVMVIGPNDELKLLIEIEDKSILVPKNIIGTVFSTKMCNQFAFGTGDAKQYFPVAPETKFIIAGFLNPEGGALEQLENVIQPLIMRFKSLEDGINLKNISFVFEEDIETVLKALKECVIWVL